MVADLQEADPPTAFSPWAHSSCALESTMVDETRIKSAVRTIRQLSDLFETRMGGRRTHFCDARVPLPQSYATQTEKLRLRATNG